MTSPLNVYNVTASYFEPRYITITVPASSLEEAAAKAISFLSEMKDAKVIDTYDINTVPAIKDLIQAQAQQLDDKELLEALGILEPVHDSKDLH